MPRIENAKVSIDIAPPREGWKSFQFNLPGFKDLPTTKGHYVETSEFSCNGHEWVLRIYPGGDNSATEEYMSIFLYHRSPGSIKTTFELKILDKFGKQNKEFCENARCFSNDGNWGWGDFILRSDILDESQDILDSKGTLTVIVSIKEEPTDVFVPKNPLVKMVKGMFLDEATADVCFEVSSIEAKKGKKKEAKASDLFHAHSSILQHHCSPISLGQMMAME